jgi:pyridoxamine 5'-phosphate oxidase
MLGLINDRWSLFTLVPMPLTPAQLAALRQEYSERGLRRHELDPDPIVQCNHWLAEAAEQQLMEPNAMTLATVDESGQPWSRTVLLKICDERGFTFFTNYEGAKGHQLAVNPRAALTFWWNALERQVNVSGTVTKTSREESERYFHSRPLGSQLGAWASPQSSVLATREDLDRQFAAVREKFGEAEIPLPPFWGGYVLRPQTIEFWQGRRSRLHDRLRYTRQPDDTWRIERLSP